MRTLSLCLFITLAAAAQAEDLPWRLGFGVIAQQQIYTNVKTSNFPLLLQDEQNQALVVPIIGYEAQNWSLGTDGARYDVEVGNSTYTLSADFNQAGGEYRYQINDFLSVGPGAAITFSGGLGWQASINSTVLSATYGQLFSDASAYIASATTGAPLWLKEGQPNFIALFDVSLQSKSHTLATADAQLNGDALNDQQLTPSAGLIHLWQLSEQFGYVVIANYAWLPEDVQQQAFRQGQISLLSFVTYKF